MGGIFVLNDGMFRVAATSFPLVVADPAANAAQLIQAARQAADNKVHLLLTAELSLTGCTCGDLFLHAPLLDGALAALADIGRATAPLPLLLVLGLPLCHRGRLYSCAAYMQGGQLLGLVPKTVLASQGDFCWPRQFATGEGLEDEAELPFFGRVPFGTKLLLRCAQLPQFCLAALLGDDVYAPASPAAAHAAAGATLLVALGAESETAASAAYRETQFSALSARLACALAYAGAGGGESTTDMVFSGQHLLFENGQLLAQAPPFSGETAQADVDADLLAQARLGHTNQRASAAGYREISFSAQPHSGAFLRPIPPLPFLPHSPAEAAQQCETILTIQAEGLRKRLVHTGAKRLILGISGGLDSTLALLVAARTLGRLGRPMRDILAVTMPCFGTTQRTRSNAETLCEALGTEFQVVDISQSVRAHFADIGQEETNPDVTFENAQARMRTLVLMDMANQCGGLVVGTGDLSELALGWATFNGDHMSMYGVNAGVPKTLVRSLVRHEAQRQNALAGVLQDILDTPVSPELLPSSGSEMSQQTESIVGPYELHDFFLYHLLSATARPAKIYRLAQQAFAGKYTREELSQWLTVFFRRFFSQQFKRSCLPDGPKVLPFSLSPRGGWQMPSDACAAAFLAECETLLADVSSAPAPTCAPGAAGTINQGK